MAAKVKAKEIDLGQLSFKKRRLFEKNNLGAINKLCVFIFSKPLSSCKEDTFSGLPYEEMLAHEFAHVNNLEPAESGNCLDGLKKSFSRKNILTYLKALEDSADVGSIPAVFQKYLKMSEVFYPAAMKDHVYKESACEDRWQSNLYLKKL